jgi:diguanylate cyclase (GGDEF)-like protein
MKAQLIALLNHPRLAFEKAPAFLKEAFVVLLVAFISWADTVTLPYISLIGFYLFPIFLAVWYCSRSTIAIVVGIAMASCIYVAWQDMPSGVPLWQMMLAYSSSVILFLGFCTLMFYLKMLVSRLREESQTDALTGLRSRRNFLTMAQFEITRVRRASYPYTLALIDLDNFKQINDTQGHAVGDELLLAASKCMLATLREVDVIGRLGGDEFLILLPETNSSEARAILGRLRDKLKCVLQTYSPISSASIGALTVCSGANDLSLADIIAKADAIMYSVKHASKDGVMVEQIPLEQAA